VLEEFLSVVDDVRGKISSKRFTKEYLPENVILSN